MNAIILTIGINDIIIAINEQINDRRLYTKQVLVIFALS